MANHNSITSNKGIKSAAIKTVGTWLKEYDNRYPIQVSDNPVVRKNRFDSILDIQIKDSWNDIPILTNEIQGRSVNEYMESTRLNLGFEALKIARLAREAYVIRTCVEGLPQEEASKKSAKIIDMYVRGASGQAVEIISLPKADLLLEPDIDSAVQDYTGKGPESYTGGGAHFMTGCIGLAALALTMPHANLRVKQIVVPSPTQERAHLTAWDRPK